MRHRPFDRDGGGRVDPFAATDIAVEAEDGVAEARTERVDDARQPDLDAADAKARQHVHHVSRWGAGRGASVAPCQSGRDIVRGCAMVWMVAENG